MGQIIVDITYLTRPKICDIIYFIGWGKDTEMDDLIDGTISGWPVSLLIERDAGSSAFGAHCAAYSDEDENSAPDDIQGKCSDISDACNGLKPAAALRKAKSMGFVPDGDD